MNVFAVACSVGVSTVLAASGQALACPGADSSKSYPCESETPGVNVTLASYEDGATCSSGTKAGYGKNLVETAVSAGSFDTLVAAVKAAMLVETLSGHDEFTVFAPTDEAFSKIPEKTLRSLLEPENRSKLQAILKYHVVPGRLEAADVVGRDALVTAGGQRIDVDVSESGVRIDGAKVVKTDVSASNGVIHVIDTVLMPESETVVEKAKGAGTFKTLVAALGAAGLAETLGSEGPFTVLAPTDEAFAALGESTIKDLLRPESKERLRSILLYHVVKGRAFSDDVAKAEKVKTLNGDSAEVRIRGGRVTVGGANVVKTDIDASNGVIHVIDTVLIPE